MDGGYPGGGSRILVRLIDEHGWYLASDLLATYQVDIRELVSGEESPRWALSLIYGLPQGSMSWARLQGDPELVGWTTQTFLLAGLIESVRDNTFATVQLKSKKRLKRPESIRIPGDHKQKRPNQNLFLQMATAQYQAGKD